MKADSEAVGAAARCLAAGGLVAFPTETVYGLGADAQDGIAVARLYDAKGRPAFNPLIAHVPDLAAARRLARFDAVAERLATALWPGPLTLVLPKASDCAVAELATAGLDSIAVRVPDHPVARDILAALGRPVVAPSANRSGHVSPTTAQHVLADLRGRIDLIVDGGADARSGWSPPSSPASASRCCCGPAACRAQRSSACSAARSAKRPRKAAPTKARPLDAPLAPGLLASHYAPRSRLRLDATSVSPGEALLAFGAPMPAGAEPVRTLNLSARGDLIEAAANLFSHLRALDAAGATAIAVMPVPHDGLGEAINDRLMRAAAPRP